MNGQTETKKEMQCIIILCQPISAAKPLWQAYQRICELNGWRVLPYRLSPYNPLLDSNSAQFLQRQSVSRQKMVLRDEDSPSFRMLATIDSNTLEKAKEADVFRINKWKDLDTLEASTAGIAFQIDQGPVSSWLGEEHGVHHFVVSSPQGNKRHRARVIIHPGRLLDWDPPTGWKDIPSLSVRDPRRTFNAQDGRLSSHLVSHDITISEADPIADWVEMIQLEGDLQLWRSIGYSPIPYGATLNSPLYYNDGMPF